MNPLKNLFLDELADRLDAEKRLILAMPKMAKTATCKHLQKLIQTHLKETIVHAKKIEKVFKSFGEKTATKKCEATIGLLKEADEITLEYRGSPAINAALISAAQKLEHYEIASYGCLHEWAVVLGNKEAAAILKGILLGGKGGETKALIDLWLAHPRQPRSALGAADGAESCCDARRMQSRPSAGVACAR